MNRFKRMGEWLKNKANQLKLELFALFIAYKRSDVPWYAKVICVMVIGYAMSPIDIIPDFIPVLGYLDDLLLLPLGIALAIKLVPVAVMEVCRREAMERGKWVRGKNYWVGGLVVMMWLGVAAIVVWWVVW